MSWKSRVPVRDIEVKKKTKLIFDESSYYNISLSVIINLEQPERKTGTSNQMRNTEKSKNNYKSVNKENVEKTKHVKEIGGKKEKKKECEV